MVIKKEENIEASLKDLVKIILNKFKFVEIERTDESIAVN